MILAEGEANFRSGVHISDALPANVLAAQGIAEDGTCDVLEVSRTVIRKVFPAKEELSLLTHVREVNLSDTEFATGDDDGWIAVVIANRLPRPDTSYGAYLISLEGRRSELPEAPGVQGELGDRYVFDLDASELAAASYTRNPALTMPLGATRDATPGGRAANATSAWTPTFSPVAGPVTGPAQSVFGAGFFENAVDFQVLEGADVQTTRFPVLAHWNFVCDAGGDFESLMTNLDIGLLGSVSQAPAEPAHPSTRRHRSRRPVIRCCVTSPVAATRPRSGTAAPLRPARSNDETPARHFTPRTKRGASQKMDSKT